MKDKRLCLCGGKIEWKTDKVFVESINCGVFDVEYCTKCNEEYLPEDSMKIVEKKLKEAGLWGVQRKEVNLWKSDNSVLVRILKDIADKLKLKPDEKIILYPEGNNKLIIEV